MPCAHQSTQRLASEPNIFQVTFCLIACCFPFPFVSELFSPDLHSLMSLSLGSVSVTPCPRMYSFSFKPVLCSLHGQFSNTSCTRLQKVLPFLLHFRTQVTYASFLCLLIHLFLCFQTSTSHSRHEAKLLHSSTASQNSSMSSTMASDVSGLCWLSARCCPCHGAILLR